MQLPCLKIESAMTSAEKAKSDGILRLQTFEQQVELIKYS